MKNLFAFTFHLPTAVMNGELIICMVFGTDYSEACRKVLEIGLPIIAQDESDLKETIKEVVQCDNDDEEAEP